MGEMKGMVVYKYQTQHASPATHTHTDRHPSTHSHPDKPTYLKMSRSCFINVGMKIVSLNSLSKFPLFFLNSLVFLRYFYLLQVTRAL